MAQRMLPCCLVRAHEPRSSRNGAGGQTALIEWCDCRHGKPYLCCYASTRIIQRRDEGRVSLVHFVTDRN